MARYQRKATLKARSETPRVRKTYSVSGRWTEYLARSGHVPVVNAFLDYYKDLDLTDTEAMFIIHLMSYKWDEQHPFPTYAKIAEVMHLKEDSLRRMTLRLQNAGFLRREKVDGRKVFDLTPLFEKLTECVKESQPNIEIESDVAKKKSKKPRGPRISQADLALLLGGTVNTSAPTDE